MVDMIEEQSLYRTVCNVSRSLSGGGIYSADEREELVSWVLARQNRHQGYYFYPTAQEREAGIWLISGEKPRAKFLVNNAVELETLRVLVLLNPEAAAVRLVCSEANVRLLAACFANGCSVGECAHASILLARYLAAWDAGESSGRIEGVLQTLKERRSAEGRWRGFPTKLTRLFLSELSNGLGEEELDYARSVRWN